MSPQSAEILGLQALGWLAGDGDRLDRFLAISGADAGILRQAVGEPHMLGAVLGFLLSDEALLLSFCEETSTRPADLHRACRMLEGPETCD
jgi:hypothetical protein